MKFYIGSRIRYKSRVIKLQEYAKALGHEITFNWAQTPEEGGQGRIRSDWRLHQKEGQEHATNEKYGVLAADVFILLLGEESGGVGSFVEFGVAAAVNKETWIVGRQYYERDSVFFCLPNVMHLNSDQDIQDLMHLRRGE